MTDDTTTSSVRRTFFLGVNTGFVADGRPDQRYLDFYARRSSPALHCAIVGNVVVPGGHGSNAVTPTLTVDRIWSELADLIRSRGSLSGIQLATAWEGYQGARKFVGLTPLNVIEQAREFSAGLGSKGVNAVLDRFKAGAAMAVEHGFGHVQIHAAHGYLLSLLIDDRINAYAACLRNGLSLLSRDLRATAVETSLRISMRTGEKNFDAAGIETFQDQVVELPFDYFDLSSGFYNIDKRLIYPARPDVLAQRFADSVALALRHSDQPFIFSGHALRLPRAQLPDNVHLGVCRDLIANPDFLTDPLNGCQSHGKCHYFSRGKQHLTCGRWRDQSDGDVVTSAGLAGSVTS